VIWLILLILLALIFGVGTLLEVTLWILIILAVLAVLGALFGGRAVGGRF
jgi:hypothetical protein